MYTMVNNQTAERFKISKDIKEICNSYNAPIKKLLAAPDGNPKLAKSLKLNVLTSVLHLAPSDMSGFNTCANASPACISGCLVYSGHGGMKKETENFSNVNKARIRKTVLFYTNRNEFFRILCKDIDALIRKAKKDNFDKVAIRLNGTSDLPWFAYSFDHEGKRYKNIFEKYPDLQFYDYSAIPSTLMKKPDNLHITFSRKENNLKACLAALELGYSVAVVFHDKLPEKLWGYEVINGDEHDYRPIDKQGVIVGLLPKGKIAKNDKKTGFIMTKEHIEQENNFVFNQQQRLAA